MTGYDAIIVGAGPAGATTALALASAGWSVALIEKTPFPRRKVCGEFMSATNATLFRDLGVDVLIHGQAGPEVRRVGLFAGARIVTAAMPRPDAVGPGWGFAMARETLDDLLVQKAAQAGATVLMPWRAIALVRDGGRQLCTVANGAETREIRAPVVVIAHGSWERGDLPTQRARPHRPGDLLAFKARFRDAALARQRHRGDCARLRAGALRVGRVLDIAARKNRAAGRAQRRADAKARIGRIGVRLRRLGGVEQRFERISAP